MSSSTTRLAYLASGIAAYLALPLSLQAEKPRPLDLAQSDPVQLGWMQGFPPPPDKLIMQPESDFFSFPKMRWTVCHFRELLPLGLQRRLVIDGVLTV